MSPDDYTALVSQQLTFTSGQSSSGDNTQCTDVNIVDDSFYEGDEVFYVKLSSNVSSVVIDPSSASTNMSITNDDSKFFKNLCFELLNL